MEENDKEYFELFDSILADINQLEDIVSELNKIEIDSLNKQLVERNQTANTEPDQLSEGSLDVAEFVRRAKEKGTSNKILTDEEKYKANKEAKQERLNAMQGGKRITINTDSSNVIEGNSDVQVFLDDLKAIRNHFNDKEIDPDGNLVPINKN